MFYKISIVWKVEFWRAMHLDKEVNLLFNHSDRFKYYHALNNNYRFILMLINLTIINLFLSSRQPIISHLNILQGAIVINYMKSATIVPPEIVLIGILLNNWVPMFKFL